MSISSTDHYLVRLNRPDPGKKPKRVSMAWIFAGLAMMAALAVLLWPNQAQAADAVPSAPALAPDTTFFVQPERMSRPEGRDARIARAHRLLGEGLSVYYQSAALVVRQLEEVPGLNERLETGHLRKLSLSIADLPRKMFAEGRYQREKTDRILRELGFSAGAGTKLWKAAGDVLDEFGAALLDPNVINNAFESPEARGE